MPDVPDSPPGANTHVRVHYTDGHPEGEIILWVKQKFVVMSKSETTALAKALIDHVTGLTAAAAPGLDVAGEPPRPAEFDNGH